MGTLPAKQIIYEERLRELYRVQAEKEMGDWS